MRPVVAERKFRETLDALNLNPEHGEWDSIRHFNLVMEEPENRITDFVMSCRAMGRTLEFFAYNHVRRELGGDAPPRIDFVPTAKNAPFAAFLDRLAAGERTTFCE